METAGVAIYQLAIMTVLIAIGFFVRKLNYVTHESTFPFNNLLIHVALPCLIISSVGRVDVESVRSQLAPTFLLGFIEFALLFLVAIAINWILRTPEKDRNLFIFLSLCTNTGFVVLPVLQTAYGDQTVVLSSIFVLMCNLFTGSIGFALLESARDGRYKISGFRITLKTLWNAPLISCLFAIGLLLCGIRLPAIAQDTMTLMGGICTPIAMIIVGIVIADAKPKEILCNWRIYAYTIIRQLALPVILALILAPYITDKMILATFVIMFAAPAGSMVPAFAQQYKQNVTLAASATVITTLACVPIFPLLMALLEIL